MNILKYLFFWASFTILSLPSAATIWITANFGSWNNSSSWIGGIVPPYSSSDTFYIAHPLVIDDPITLQPGGFFNIDTAGGICGHQRMVIHTSALLHNRGILELDSLFVPGGIVQNFFTGNLILPYNAIISNGGYLTSNGSIAIGPWFICHQPEYGFLTSSPEADPITHLKTYPNPAARKIYIESNSVVAHVVIKNLIGMQVAYIRIENNEVPLEQLPNGLYLFEFYDKEKAGIAFQKIMVLK